MKKLYFSCLVLLLTVVIAHFSTAQTILTVAGNGQTSELNKPQGLAVDSEGNVYIADQSNHRIRKLDTDGMLTTVAGTGSAGFSGDDGPATEAQLNYPTGVSLDAAGNLYIADQQNHRIRKVNTSGIITTVAGNGYYGYQGDGGLATEARLDYPIQTVTDAGGNLYIADRANDCVRKVDTYGIITTVAGTGTRGTGPDGGLASDMPFCTPSSVRLDAGGNLYIVEKACHRIRKVDTNGIVSTLAGTGNSGFSGDGGLATEAELNNPHDLTFDDEGNIFIVDGFNHRIRKIDANGIITTVAGNGLYGFSGDGSPAPEAKFATPYYMEMDAKGNFYIADYGNHRIRKVMYAAPFGYSVAFDQEVINASEDQSAVSFTAEGAEVGATYLYTVSSSGDSNTVSGTGTISTQTEQFSGVDVSGLPDGTLTLRFTLIDSEDNVGAAATSSVVKDVTAPEVLTKNHTVTLSTEGLAVITEADIDAGSTDNMTAAENLVFRLDYSQFTTKDAGEQQVTLTVTDEAGNSQSATALVTVEKRAQSLTFEPLPQKGYGDHAFILQAASDAGLEVSFSSSDENSVSIDGDSLMILKAGTVTITAQQAGDSLYQSATPVEQTLVIEPAVLTVKVKDTARIKGEENPVFELIYEGFQYDDTASDLEVVPTANSEATPASPVGTYDITVSGGEDANYTFHYETGILIVNSILGLTAQSERLEVYPNPTNRYMIIKGRNGEEIEVNLYNPEGLLVLNKEGKGPLKMDLQSLPQGLYLAKVAIGNQQQTVRVIITK